MSCVPLWHASQSHRHQSAWDLLPGEWFRLEEGADMWPSLDFGKLSYSWSVGLVGRTFHIPLNRKGWETRKMCHGYYHNSVSKKGLKPVKNEKMAPTSKTKLFIFFSITLLLHLIFLSSHSLWSSNSLKTSFNSFKYYAKHRYHTNSQLNTDEYKQG